MALARKKRGILIISSEFGSKQSHYVDKDQSIGLTSTFNFLVVPKPIVFFRYFHRVQLAVCLSVVLKYDYPGRWDTVLDTLSNYLTVDNPGTLHGALISVYQLVKNYE